MTTVNFYDKDQVDAKLDTKAEKSTTYTKTEINDALALKADASTTYNKTEVNDALALKADASTTYNKTEVDDALALKADKSDTYTKAQVNAKRTIIECATMDALISATSNLNIGDEILVWEIKDTTKNTEISGGNFVYVSYGGGDKFCSGEVLAGSINGSANRMCTAFNIRTESNSVNLRFMTSFPSGMSDVLITNADTYSSFNVRVVKYT